MNKNNLLIIDESPAGSVKIEYIPGYGALLLGGNPNAADGFEPIFKDDK